MTIDISNLCKKQCVLEYTTTKIQLIIYPSNSKIYLIIFYLIMIYLPLAICYFK